MQPLIKFEEKIVLFLKNKYKSFLYKKNTFNKSESLSGFYENELDKNLNDFDENFYKHAYPDITAAKVDPYQHFYASGKSEGRIGVPYSIEAGAKIHCSSKDTVLIVSHEANRTGAPILALNLCQELNRQFNVIVIINNGGELTPIFKDNSNVLIKYYAGQVLSESFEYQLKLINFIKQKYDIKFSIVNSVESSSILHPLAELFIPSVLLIHEFYTTTNPQTKFINSLLWSGKVVFPAQIVKENAITDITKEAIGLTQIIPQGRCQIPNLLNQENLAKEEHLSIRTSTKPFVVLGAGTIEYRKGVDIFIATAVHIKKSNLKLNIQMIWVGSVPNIAEHQNYNKYLKDQLKRFELNNEFKFVDETSDIKQYYNMADIFFLSSRLDPLPNVAIDAMSLGIPTICFENVTGIAEFLSTNQETRACIIPYLCPSESAKKIIALANSSIELEKISVKVKSVAADNFRMKNYIEKVSTLMKYQIKISENEKNAYLLLKNSEEFKNDFFSVTKNREESIRIYIRSWYSKINFIRKPAPGFNPLIFDEMFDCSKQSLEPFSEFVEQNKPQGPWQESIIEFIDCFKQPTSNLKCAIHIHVYYVDLLNEILHYLNGNLFNYDLLISTTDANESAVHEILKHYPNNYYIKVVPNIGRDIGPLFTEFKDLIQHYDVIGHFHTKKSLAVSDSETIKLWVNFLFSNLLDGTIRVADQIINKFEQNKKLGLIFADDPYLGNWGKNKKLAQALAKTLRIQNIPNNSFSYPVGNMFWARTTALKSIFLHNWTWDLYPKEPIPNDGTILHALERLTPSVVAEQGYEYSTTYRAGITR